MFYNNYMDEKRNYTEEEIKQMSYWQLWEIRRKAGLWYYMPLLAIYSFLLYAFFKIIYIFLKSDTLEFKVDLWIIPIILIMGPLYYYGHEIYYKNIYLKNKK